MPSDSYLIESMEHTYDDAIAWWRPMKRGYTVMVDNAGRYSFEEAKQICEDAGPKNERMWPESQVLAGKAGAIGRVVMKR